MLFLIQSVLLLTLYLSSLVLCFAGSNILTIFFGIVILILTVLFNLLIIAEYIKSKSLYKINDKLYTLEKQLYKEFGNLDIDSAKKLIESKENILENKSKGSKIRNFYFKYIRKEINEKEIAEHVLSKIIHDKEIKEKKILRKENKRIKELESKKEIKIISI